MAHLRWPFVSRERFDEQRSHYEARLSAVTTVAADVTEESAAKSWEIERLRAQLAALQDHRTATQRQRSRLTQAIREQARMPNGSIDQRLLAHFRAVANQRLNDGQDIEDVIAGLSEWDTTERRSGLTADRMADLAEELP